MTNEEALKILKYRSGWNLSIRDVTALNMAIKALESCYNSDEMAISESKKKIVVDNYFKSECDINTSIKEAFTKGFELGLKKAPIPRPKTGHWIEVEKYSDGKHKIKCSECRSHIIDRGHANSYVVKEKYKYCPRCGAKMIEPQESEE